MAIQTEAFGVTHDGTSVACYTLRSPDGFGIRVIPYGCRLVSLFAPDRDGHMDDILWGYDDIRGYLTPRDSQGAVIGRYAGLIAGAQLTVDQKLYPLTKNAGKHQLHGGTGSGSCFSEKVWKVEAVGDDDGAPSMVLSLFSPDGEGGFPGNLRVKTTYTVKDHSLRIDFEAVCDQNTVLNLTSHGFFNLAGYSGPSVNDQWLLVHADAWTPTDEEGIPTGEIRSVKNTAMDFSCLRRIGQYANQMPEGYNCNFALANPELGTRDAAILYDTSTGREMRVQTDLPGLQVYTAGRIPKGKTGKSGLPMLPQHAICLEAQHFPDSVHHPNFPSTVLKANQLYAWNIQYRFAVRHEVNELTTM